MIVMLRVVGTPSAVPIAPAKLERMSPRTTPSWSRAFGPFVPSPGNGPAVSSGIGSVLTAAGVDSVVADVPVVASVVLDVVDGDDDEEPLDPHAAATVTTPTPASSFNASRRWSTLGGSGTAGSESRRIMR